MCFVICVKLNKMLVRILSVCCVQVIHREAVERSGQQQDSGGHDDSTCLSFPTAKDAAHCCIMHFILPYHHQPGLPQWVRLITVD